MQGLRVNGAPYDKTYLPHDRARRRRDADVRHGPGAVELGDRRATPRRPRSPPATRCRSRCATPPAAAAAADRERRRRRAALFDDTSATQASLTGARGGSSTRSPAAEPQRFYTLTSGTATGGDPRGWAEGLQRRRPTWTAIDARAGQRFKWRSQTRAVQGRRPAELRALPARVPEGGRPRWPRSSCSTTTTRCRWARRSETRRRLAGSTVPVR